MGVSGTWLHHVLPVKWTGISCCTISWCYITRGQNLMVFIFYHRSSCLTALVQVQILHCQIDPRKPNYPCSTWKSLVFMRLSCQLLAANFFGHLLPFVMKRKFWGQFCFCSADYIMGLTHNWGRSMETVIAVQRKVEACNPWKTMCAQNPKQEYQWLQKCLCAGPR